MSIPRTTTLAAIAAAFPALAWAGTTESSPFDRAWALATLYRNDRNPYLQEFKLRGRYHGQYYKVDADQGNTDHWEDRRSRFGFDAKLFEKRIEVRVDFQSNDGFSDFYDGLVDAYIRWKPSKDFSVTVGKVQTMIAHFDWLGSSNSQPTFERSQIFAQLGINRATAVTVEGTADRFTYRAGIYSNDTPSSTGGSGSWGDGEFGDFNGGVSTSLGVGYDFKAWTGLDKSDFRLDWLHSDRKTGDLVLNRYDDILTTTFWLQHEAATLVMEGFYVSGGDGENSDAFGFYLEPLYDLVPEKLQLVGRYSYSHSSGDRGLIAATRYERTVVGNSARGDQYHSIYLGAQYFIHGDKLKLMAGTEWSRLRGPATETYQGFTYLTGLRFSF
ncbi:MAG: porin [Luteolibacter sp.]